MYINQQAEQTAKSHGWTYKTGYQQGYNAGYYGRGNTNYFPKFSSAWHGWKAGNKDGKKAFKTK